jgi:hypothetical protein
MASTIHSRLSSSLLFRCAIEIPALGRRQSEPLGNARILVERGPLPDAATYAKKFARKLTLVRHEGDEVGLADCTNDECAAGMVSIVGS